MKIPHRMKTLNYTERGHYWVGDDDGDEFCCENCGRTVWITQDAPGLTQAVLRFEDCETEILRQVMDS